MKKITASLLGMFVAAGVLSVAIVSAQEPQQPPPDPRPQARPMPAPAPHPPMDPLGEAMFPPEMIMQHQRELALTDEQKTFMRKEIQRTTTRFNELQWQLQDAMEALHETMKRDMVDEQQALAQLDKVLNSESEIKHLHMELAIRIKNKLTAEQQAKLHAMRHMMDGGPDGGPGRGPGPGGPGRGPGGPGRPGEPGAEGGPPPIPRPEGAPQPNGAPTM